MRQSMPLIGSKASVGNDAAHVRNGWKADMTSQAKSPRRRSKDPVTREFTRQTRRCSPGPILAAANVGSAPP